jgi:hypothetical protein
MIKNVYFFVVLFIRWHDFLMGNSLVVNMKNIKLFNFSGHAGRGRSGDRDGGRSEQESYKEGGECPLN